MLEFVATVLKAIVLMIMIAGAVTLLTIIIVELKREIWPKFRYWTERISEGALRNGDVLVLEPFYREVTLHLDCIHGPEYLKNVYNYEIPIEYFCTWCGEFITVEDIVTSEKMVFEHYINPD